MKKFLSSYPELVKEWHPTKNGDKSPKDFTHGSGQKVWWLCPKGHSYDSVIKERTKKNPTSCPVCAGQKTSEESNLSVSHPEIAQEWHPTKNGDKSPKDFTHGSGQKVWWLCPKGHSYDSVIKNRTGINRGCRFCTGQKPSKENNLSMSHPEIAQEWHPTKNGDKSPEDFTYGSTQKIWWLCPKTHEYESVITSRTRKKPTGCPLCSNQSSEPEIRILSELKWFFDEINSRYKINGVEIDIFLPIYNLGIEYDGSYFHKDKENNDLRKNKFLLSQNINLIRVRELPLRTLSDNDVVVDNGSLEKADLDEILKKIYPFVEDRIKEKINTYVVKSSFVNQELFQEYRSYFPSPFPEYSLLETHPLISSEWHYEMNHPLKPENFSYGSGNEVWWLCPRGDEYKSKISNRAILDRGCPFCSGHKVSEKNNLLKLFPDVSKEWHPKKNGDLKPQNFSYGSNVKVWWLCPKGHSYDSIIISRTRKNPTGCPYCLGNKVSKDNNLLISHPKIAQEWHPTKNGDLTPSDFTYGSGQKVWWLCPKDHSYDSVICNRTGPKQGCPFCSSHLVSVEKNLSTLFPEVAQEWHPQKNGELMPDMFLSRSHKKVWWLCPRKHEYESIISNRTKPRKPTGCPHCSSRKKTQE
jgi:hypothetical protein